MNEQQNSPKKAQVCICTYPSPCRPKGPILLAFAVFKPPPCLVAPGAREKSVLSVVISLSNTGSFH